MFSVLFLSLLSGCHEAPSQKTPTDYRLQEKVTELTQNAIHYLTNNGNLSEVESPYFYGIQTEPGKYNYLLTTLNEAHTLDPERLDIHFSLAFTYIFNKNIDKAHEEFEKIIKKDPDYFNAAIAYATCSKLKGDASAFNTTINTIKKKFPEQTERYINKFKRLDELERLTLNTTPITTNKSNHAIVILSYVLDEDGTMNSAMIERLKQGLAAAEKNPDALIIVSGGGFSGHIVDGITLAYRMQHWLLEKGVPASRIILEDRSMDTTGNAINSFQIVARQGIQYVTLVTSANHMRRSLINFEEAAKRFNLDVQLDHLASPNYGPADQEEKLAASEKIGFYRDMLRASGIWSYPGVKM